MQLNSTFRYIWKHKLIYLLALPGVLFFIVFKYIPMLGIVIAFQDYSIYKGVLGSEWVGLKHFIRMWEYPDFLRILKNTLLINLYDLIIAFTLPIILALMLNEVRQIIAKRLIQTVVYMPHFLSWVIISGIFIGILSPSTGLINQFLNLLGFDSIYFLGEDTYVRSI